MGAALFFLKSLIKSMNYFFRIQTEHQWLRVFLMVSLGISHHFMKYHHFVHRRRSSQLYQIEKISKNFFLDCTFSIFRALYATTTAEHSQKPQNMYQNGPKLYFLIGSKWYPQSECTNIFSSFLGEKNNKYM